MMVAALLLAIDLIFSKFRLLFEAELAKQTWFGSLIGKRKTCANLVRASPWTEDGSKTDQRADNTITLFRHQKTTS